MFQRHARGVVERHAGSFAEIGIGRHCQRAQRHAVKTVRECHDFRAAGDQSGEFQRGFDRICPGRPGELHAVIHTARFQDDLGKGFQEVALGRRGGIEAVGYAVGIDELDQCVLHLRVVVPEIQHARTAEKVDIGPAVFIHLAGIRCGFEDRRIGAHVAANFRLPAIKGFKACLWVSVHVGVLSA